jgi:hypothetical protein
MWGVVPFAPYRVLFNTSQGGPNVLAEMIHSIDEAVLSRNIQSDAKITVSTKKFPNVLPQFANENGTSLLLPV